jgi:hypothetical protein
MIELLITLAWVALALGGLVCAIGLVSALFHCEHALDIVAIGFMLLALSPMLIMTHATLEMIR